MNDRWMFTVAMAAGCGVESAAEPSGGVDLEEAGAGVSGAESTPIRGFAVVGSDFTSSSISLLSLGGEVVSASLISSASSNPGLSAALGGDLALSSTTLTGSELLVIDRFPSAVLSWVDLQTAQVRAQLSVATGYSSNPHDYVPFSATKAFVPRFEPNLMSGLEDFDAGSDVLIVNPTTARVEGRIDLTGAFAGEAPGIYPRPDRALIAGGKLRVLAVGLSADFTAIADSRLITIDPETNAIEEVLILDGMTSCGSAALSPNGTELAIACGGDASQDPAQGFPDSGVVLVNVADEFLEARRWTSSQLGVGQVNRLAWTNADQVALLTFGRFNADFSAAEASDEGRTLNIRDGEVSDPWLSAGPFNLGDIACTLGNVCLVADAEAEGGVVHRLSIGPQGELRVEGRVKPDAASGLPPRSIGTY
jgi:hypothetical protein